MARRACNSQKRRFWARADGFVKLLEALRIDDVVLAIPVH
jgi:hypothetical protein